MQCVDIAAEDFDHVVVNRRINIEIGGVTQVGIEPVGSVERAAEVGEVRLDVLLLGIPLRQLNEAFLRIDVGDGPLPLDEVLDALLRPVFEMLSGQAKEFTPIMGRIFTESAELTEQVFQKHLAHVAQRFLPAFQRALPDLPLVELLWRLQFVYGVMSQTMGAGRIVKFLAKGQCDTTDVDATMRRVETFLLAGLRAPVPVEVEHAAH